jgi:hypothetical protein
MRTVPAAVVHLCSARLLRCVGVAALAIGCACLTDGGAAEASSCGHYVKRLGPGFVPGKAAAQRVAATEVAHSKPAQSPCGCRGPECHRAPLDPTPLAPSAPLRTLSQQDLTLLADESLTLALSSRWLVGDVSAEPASGYPLRMDRPPIAAL